MYLVEVLIDTCITAENAVLMALYVLIPIGTCLLFEACLDDLINEFKEVKEKTVKKGTKLLQKERFIEILQFQTDTIT